VGCRSLEPLLRGVETVLELHCRAGTSAQVPGPACSATTRAIGCSANGPASAAAAPACAARARGLFAARSAGADPSFAGGGGRGAGRAGSRSVARARAAGVRPETSQSSVAPAPNTCGGRSRAGGRQGDRQHRHERCWKKAALNNAVVKPPATRVRPAAGRPISRAVRAPRAVRGSDGSKGVQDGAAMAPEAGQGGVGRLCVRPPPRPSPPAAGSRRGTFRAAHRGAVTKPRAAQSRSRARRSHGAARGGPPRARSCGGPPRAAPRPSQRPRPRSSRRAGVELARGWHGAGAGLARGGGAPTSQRGGVR